jgi:hypothetical protein
MSLPIEVFVNGERAETVVLVENIRRKTLEVHVVLQAAASPRPVSTLYDVVRSWAMAPPPGVARR